MHIPGSSVRQWEWSMTKYHRFYECPDNQLRYQERCFCIVHYCAWWQSPYSRMHSVSSCNVQICPTSPMIWQLSIRYFLQLQQCILRITELLVVSSIWYLKEIQIRVYRILFFTHVSDNVVGTYCDLFEQWGSIPPEYQEMFFAIHMNRIDTINGWDQQSPSGKLSNPGMAIDYEDM